MKKLSFAIAAIAAIAVLALAGAAHAQAPVNIVYPISGGIYPITGPAPGPLSSAYFTSSFSTTCPGGSYTVQWGFDAGPAVGTASFYDQASVQFESKLPGGNHTFWVTSSCGSSQVRFRIGN
jgi:hypothetical protein